MADDDRQLWVAAIKLPIYSVAVMPIWVGSAMVSLRSLPIHGFVFSLFLVSAICILAWTNISNDVFDSETGIDKTKQHSVVNLVGDVSRVFWIGNVFLALGVAGILGIGWLQQDPMVPMLVGGAIGLGYLYQGPPFRWGYLGLGEILCFFAFGPLATSAAYYSQCQSWTPLVGVTSVLVGVVTSLILFCSHFNQVTEDQAAGKLSPVVRLGTERSAQLIPWICGGVYGVTGGLIVLQVFPVWTLMSVVSLPFVVELSTLLQDHHAQPQRIKHCRFIAVYVHFSYCLLLGGGFVLTYWLG